MQIDTHITREGYCQDRGRSNGATAALRRLLEHPHPNASIFFEGVGQNSISALARQAGLSGRFITQGTTEGTRVWVDPLYRGSRGLSGDQRKEAA